MSLTKEHLQVVFYLQKTMEELYYATFFDDYKRISSDEYLFGSDDLDKNVPCIVLRFLGGGMGDYYSGYIDEHEIYYVYGVKKTNGNTLDLTYERMNTSLVGKTSALHSNNLLADEKLDLYIVFNKYWDMDIEVPQRYLELI